MDVLLGLAIPGAIMLFALGLFFRITNDTPYDVLVPFINGNVLSVQSVVKDDAANAASAEHGFDEWSESDVSVPKGGRNGPSQLYAICDKRGGFDFRFVPITVRRVG